MPRVGPEYFCPVSKNFCRPDCVFYKPAEERVVHVSFHSTSAYLDTYMEPATCTFRNSN